MKSINEELYEKIIAIKLKRDQESTPEEKESNSCFVNEIITAGKKGFWERVNEEDMYVLDHSGKIKGAHVEGLIASLLEVNKRELYMVT